jgi:hypothetical protein
MTVFSVARYCPLIRWKQHGPQSCQTVFPIKCLIEGWRLPAGSCLPLLSPCDIPHPPTQPASFLQALHTAASPSPLNGWFACTLYIQIRRHIKENKEPAKGTSRDACVLNVQSSRAAVFLMHTIKAHYDSLCSTRRMLVNSKYANFK